MKKKTNIKFKGKGHQKQEGVQWKDVNPASRQGIVGMPSAWS